MRAQLSRTVARTAAIGALFLLLGAATNLGLASYCSLNRCKPETRVVARTADGKFWWTETRGRGWSLVSPWNVCGDGVGRTVLLKPASGHKPWWADFDKRHRGSNMFWSSGWPFPSFWACLHFSPNVPRAPGVVVAGINIASNSAGQPNYVLLPLNPIWPGLLANTAIFSACWLAPFAAPGLFIRNRRRRRGHCPRCAYDLRHDLAPGCPECGWRRA